MTGLRIEIEKGAEGLAKLRSAWDQLAVAKAFHFLHFSGWYSAQIGTSAGKDSVYWAALYDGGELFAVLPFERVVLRKGPLRLPILQLFYPNEMGVNDVFSSRALLPYRHQLLTELRRQLPYFTLIRWQCVLRDGCASTILQAAERPRFTHASKFIEFSAGFAAFWESYSSKFRKGLQKKMRKAEEQGSLRLWCATEPHELQPAFEHFLEVEDSGWKGEGGTSIKKQPAKLAYYRHLLEFFAVLGLCQINLLYLNETPIAAQFGVRVGKRLFLLKIGFREDFAAVSPGYLILYKLIEQSAAGDAIASVSFVTGVNWIDRWHPQEIPVGVFYLDKGTPLSALAVRALVLALGYRDKRRKIKPAEILEPDD